LPSKRARKIPEKIQVSKEDLDELKSPSEPAVDITEEKKEESDLSLDELSEAEAQTNEANPEDTNPTNS
jgi:DNA-directed RNA polymerase subunit omega